MNQQDLGNAVYELSSTNSRTEKKDIIRNEFADSEYGIAILAGQRFDDIGIGKKTFEKAVKKAMPEADAELDDHATYVEALRSGTNDLRSVQGLYEDCLQLADRSGHDQRDYLVEMLNNHNPPMVAFAVLRAKSGVYSTGATENTIAKAFCEPRDIDYNRALGLEPDVAKLVQRVQAGADEFTPTVGKAFKPMLAKNKDLPDERSSWNAQLKIDGYRLLVHVNNENGYPKVAAYTRRLNDVTDSLPELREIDWPEERFILDCEVIAEDGKYKSTSERVGADDFDRNMEMNFKCFDMILDQGEDVSREEYHVRYGRLARLVHLADDERVERLDMHSIEDGKLVAENEGKEGIIAKDLFSEYKFNKRSSAWRKSKNTFETVDVVVSGFVEGEGRNDGRLGKVVVETADGVGVGGVGTGFTDAEREEIWNNQDDWRGSTIEVTAEAFDESLRFPAFERRRDDDGEPDTVERLKEILPDDA